MNGDESLEPSGHLVFEFQFDEPPEKLWRAISTPGIRENWLPDADLADPEPSVVAPGEALRYRMRAGEPPFLESIVTFRIAANPGGGASLQVIHEWPGGIGRLAHPANGNDPPLMRAA